MLLMLLMLLLLFWIPLVLIFVLPTLLALLLVLLVLLVLLLLLCLLTRLIVVVLLLCAAMVYDAPRLSVEFVGRVADGEDDVAAFIIIIIIFNPLFVFLSENGKWKMENGKWKMVLLDRVVAVVLLKVYCLLFI
jgi:hypothetical protein